LAEGHIFVSYSSADRAFAEDLVRQLESGGNRIWFAPRNVRPGIDYSEQIQAAIESAGAFIIIISDAANESDFVRAETEMAFSRRRPIFPVRRSTVPPAPGLALFLQLRHWTDAFGPGRHEAVARLSRELVDLGRSGRHGRKKGSLYRPSRPSATGREGARSGLIIALGLAGGLALVAAVFLLIQPQDPARTAPGPDAGGAITNGVGAVAPGTQTDMTPLVETWMRYIIDTTPPPLPEENLVADNAVNAVANSTAAPANDAAAAGANTVGM